LVEGKISLNDRSPPIPDYLCRRRNSGPALAPIAVL
jgi:hypothetical protein